MPDDKHRTPLLRYGSILSTWGVNQGKRWNPSLSLVRWFSCSTHHCCHYGLPDAEIKLRQSKKRYSLFKRHVYLILSKDCLFIILIYVIILYQSTWGSLMLRIITLSVCYMKIVFLSIHTCTIWDVKSWILNVVY